MSTQNVVWCDLCASEIDESTMMTLVPPMGSLNAAFPAWVCPDCHDALWNALADKAKLRVIIGLCPKKAT